MTSLSGLTQHLETTGHSRREARLVDVMLTDAQRAGQLMLTNGSAQRLYPECTLSFDGSVRSNPSVVGGCGWHLEDHRGYEIERSGKRLRDEQSGVVTNNVAEYEGLINGIQSALREGVKRIKVRGDSELVINHMTGVYKCNAKLRPYRDEALALARNFQSIEYEWVPRSDNVIADEQANLYSR